MTIISLWVENNKRRIVILVIQQMNNCLFCFCWSMSKSYDWLRHHTSCIIIFQLYRYVWFLMEKSVNYMHQTDGSCDRRSEKSASQIERFRFLEKKYCAAHTLILWHLYLAFITQKMAIGFHHVFFLFTVGMSTKLHHLITRPVR